MSIPPIRCGHPDCTSQGATADFTTIAAARQHIVNCRTHHAASILHYEGLMRHFNLYCCTTCGQVCASTSGTFGIFPILRAHGPRASPCTYDGRHPPIGIPWDVTFDVGNIAPVPARVTPSVAPCAITAPSSVPSAVFAVSPTPPPCQRLLL